MPATVQCGISGLCRAHGALPQCDVPWERAMPATVQCGISGLCRAHGALPQCDVPWERAMPATAAFRPPLPE